MNSYEVAKNFFSLDDRSLLNDKGNLLELRRRVQVFSDALGKFDSLHRIFKDAYDGTPYSISSKKEYKLQGAKGYVSELLFGDSEQHLFSIEEKERTISEINSLFKEESRSDLHQMKKEIKENLIRLLDIAYPENKINTSGLLQQCTQTKRIFQLLELYCLEDTHPVMVEGHDFYKDINIDDIIFEIQVMKGKYSDLAYELFQHDHLKSLTGYEVENRTYRTKFSYSSFGYGGEISRVGDRGIGKDKFIEKLTELMRLLTSMKEIRKRELQIASRFAQIDWRNISDDDILEIEAMVVSHLGEHDVVSLYKQSERYTKRDEKPEITYSEIKSIKDIEATSVPYLHYESDGIFFQTQSLKDIGRHLATLMRLSSFDNIVGRANYDAIAHDKEMYGAKGAYLNSLDRMSNRLADYSKEHSNHRFMIPQLFEVPTYELISIDEYKNRKESGKVDKKLIDNLYKKWKGKPVIIRSSAVNSEDNDISTGAGIYVSIPIGELKSKKQVREAIQKVYESCDSKEAKSYRKENNIKEEYMGLVVQDYHDTLNKGFANSILPNRPELLEVSRNRGGRIMRPVYLKKNLEHTVLSNSFDMHEDEKAQYFKIDLHRREVEDTGNCRRLAKQLVLLERIYGKNIQVEFVFEKKWEYDEEWGRDREHETLYLVQVRPLPKSLIEPIDVDFPNAEALWEGRALGVANDIYKVLRNGDDNNEEKGFISFTSNYFGSYSTAHILNSFPKEGIVNIRRNSGKYGHVETLAVEKGLTVLFPDEDTIIKNNHEYKNDTLRGRHGIDDIHRSFYGFKQVKVVSDGFKGKIYGVKCDEEE